MASSVTSPSPRISPFTASSRDTGYLWGGDGDTEPEAVLLYSVNTETWTRKLTKGPHPPAGLCNGGCSIAGQHLYLYGGYYGSSRSGSLYQLNTDTWTWRELSNCSAGGPGKKSGCRMITYQDQLLVVGGSYGHTLETRQPGARYENGYTNEIHCYSLASGTWSSPLVNGLQPRPCRDHSLTMVAGEQAVMFGGSYSEGIFSVEISDVNILHLPTMTWRKIPHKQNTPWPIKRSGNISSCLGYGGQNKSLLVSGGYRGMWSALNDMWILDIQSGHWEEIPISKQNVVERYGHCAASFTIDSNRTEVMLFGGEKEADMLFGREKEAVMLFGGEDEGSQTMADTSVLQFECQTSGRTRKWSLTAVADSTQLGTPSRLREKRILMESATQEGSSRDEEVRRLQQQLQQCQLRAQQSEELHRQVAQYERRAEVLQGQVAQSNRSAEESDRRAEESERRSEESQRRAQHLERSLGEMRQRLRENEDRLRAYDTHWVVRTEEIELTGPELGRGAWATVSVAKFRGAQVAVKRIHNLLVSRHNAQLFRREMTMASKLRHPNLVQFIGATVEGDMMIVMEFMTTSLRRQLQNDEYFQPGIVKSISLDIAKALNYLHQIQPDPIVHRDISSANVLLEEISRPKLWKAKVTDYGTVNLVRQINTENPGGPAYAAPEANTPHLQSPKMDIYSFGALVLEMLTGQLPAPDDRAGLLCQVFHEQLLDLIRECLSENTADRPTARAIITVLS